MDSRYVALDTETNGKDVRDGTGKCFGISFAFRLPGDEIESFYVPFFHPYSMNYSLDALRPAIQKILDTKPVISHNAPFDKDSLNTIGFNAYDSLYFCTLKLSHMLDENQFSYELDALAKSWLEDNGKRMKGTPLDKYVKAYGWGEVPSGLVCDYAGWDANLHLRLFEYVWPKLVQEGTAKLWPEKSKVMSVVSRMERRGILIDPDLCESQANRGHQRMNEISTYLGGKNPSSRADLISLLIDDLGLERKYNNEGKLTFDKKAMAEYELELELIDNPVAKLILEYRGWQKSVSSNYEAYLKMVSSDGRLRCHYKHHGTVTGRLSCEKPNLQQIPRNSAKDWNGNLKNCFVARPGYVLIEPDFKNLEFRLASAYAEETGLLEIFNDPDADVFAYMRDELKMERQDCKTLTYLIQYGGGVKRLMLTFGVSKIEAQHIIYLFYTAYPGLLRQRRIATNKANISHRVRLWSGRYRHFSFRSEHHKAFNAAVQGGCADIVEGRMLALDSAFNGNEECSMLLQVHDSLVLEVLKEKELYYAQQVREIMEDVQPDFGVKFYVDLHYWGGDKIILPHREKEKCTLSRTSQ